MPHPPMIKNANFIVSSSLPSFAGLDYFCAPPPQKGFRWVNKYFKIKPLACDFSLNGFVQIQILVKIKGLNFIVINNSALTNFKLLI